MRTLEQNLRIHPAGTVTELSVDLGFGTYERISAAVGPFAATYGQYAIFMAAGSIHGPVQLNGSKSLRGPSAPEIYSVLRPNDHVTGVLERELVYEILLLSPEFVEQFIRIEADGARAFLPLILRVEAPPLVKSIWRRLSACIESYDADAASRATTLVELLIVKLIEVQVGAPNPADALDNLEAVKRAVRFIDDHLSEQLDVNAIAQAANLSPFYFSRIFKAAYQISLHQFVVERRLERARQLLSETDLAISAIALETGFSSQSHLTTIFRQRFGIPPAHFRASGGWATWPASTKTDRN